MMIISLVDGGGGDTATGYVGNVCIGWKCCCKSRSLVPCVCSFAVLLWFVLLLSIAPDSLTGRKASVYLLTYSWFSWLGIKHQFTYLLTPDSLDWAWNSLLTYLLTPDSLTGHKTPVYLLTYSWFSWPFLSLASAVQRQQLPTITFPSVNARTSIATAVTHNHLAVSKCTN